MTAAAAAVAKQLSLGRETVRRWVVQAEVDAGIREGMTNSEREDVRKPKRERVAVPTVRHPAPTLLFVLLKRIEGDVWSITRGNDLEWLVRPANFAKVVEGKYEDGK